MTTEENVKLVVILAHVSDLGKMHGPAKEVYKWSDPSGTRESSSQVDPSHDSEIPTECDQEAGEGDRGQPLKEGGGWRGGRSTEGPDEKKCSVGPNAGGVIAYMHLFVSSIFLSCDKPSKFNIKVLPRKSGRYLRAILGNVDCNILDRNEKYQYKEQYEQFKLIVNLLGGVLAIASYFFDFLVLDKLGMFLIVWYYCTLTIRWVVPAYRY